MKGKLIILIGISNSGKSTFASKLVQDDPKTYIRINRDDIRNLLFGYTDETISSYYHRSDINQLEKQVTRFEDTLIYDSLELGRTVIVDATHLKRAYIERFKYWNVPTEVKFFPIDYDEAIGRNSKRSRKVDEGIIKKQLEQLRTLVRQLKFIPIDFTPIVLDNSTDKVPAIVFDIDGTLAHKVDRSAYDWLKVGEDTVDLGVSTIVSLMNIGIKTTWSDYESRPKIIIATGRDGVSLEETEKWLGNNEIKYDEIYIRPKGDSRADWIVKKEMAEVILKNNHILGWFDDRLQVSRHLRMLGLNVYNVSHGNF